MPLENIEIKNITIRRALTGIEEPVNADLTVARLNSNGTVKCLMPATTSTTTISSNPRRLRRTLQATDDSVNVNYDIVAPTEDVFTADLSTDANVMAVATSVGSTGVIATTSTGGQPVTQAPPAPQTVSTSPSTLGIGIGVAGGVVAFVAVGALIIQSQRRQKVNRSVVRTSTSRVVMLTQENPINNPANVNQSQRVVFTPYGARV
jgi:hypothetical protein